MKKLGLKIQTASTAIAIAMLLVVVLSASVSAHPGHEHPKEPTANWTERIDEVVAGGGVLILIGGVFWLTNRRAGASGTDDQRNTGPDSSAIPGSRD